MTSTGKENAGGASEWLFRHTVKSECHALMGHPEPLIVRPAFLNSLTVRNVLISL
jgi:hypothetical protein